MNIYLLDRQTGQFYAGDQGWVTNQAEAHCFPSSFDAIQRALKIGRTSTLEFVYAFEDPHNNFTVPFEARA